MTAEKVNARIITKRMFHLLPIQVVLAAVGAVNGSVSSFSQATMWASTQ